MERENSIETESEKLSKFIQMEIPQIYDHLNKEPAEI